MNPITDFVWFWRSRVHDDAALCSSVVLSSPLQHAETPPHATPKELEVNLADYNKPICFVLFRELNRRISPHVNPPCDLSDCHQKPLSNIGFDKSQIY